MDHQSSPVLISHQVELVSQGYSPSKQLMQSSQYISFRHQSRLKDYIMYIYLSLNILLELIYHLENIYQDTQIQDNDNFIFSLIKLLIFLVLIILKQIENYKQFLFIKRQRHILSVLYIAIFLILSIIEIYQHPRLFPQSNNNQIWKTCKLISISIISSYQIQYYIAKLLFSLLSIISIPIIFYSTQDIISTIKQLIIIFLIFTPQAIHIWICKLDEQEIDNHKKELLEQDIINQRQWNLIPAGIIQLTKEKNHIKFANNFVRQFFAKFFTSYSNEDIENILLQKFDFKVIQQQQTANQFSEKRNLKSFAKSSKKQSIEENGLPLRLNSNNKPIKSMEESEFQVQNKFQFGKKLFSMNDIIQMLKEGQLSSMKDILDNFIEVHTKISPIKFASIKEDISIKCKIHYSPDEQFIMIVIEDLTKFEKTSKLESQENFKQKLFCTFSHELRTPLNSALNYLQIAHMNKDADPTLDQNCIYPAIKSLQMQLFMINDFLDFSQFQANKDIQLNIETLDVNEFVQEIKELFENSFKKKGIKFFIKIKSKFTQIIQTDIGRLKQIVINLINNSLKFTTQGSVMMIIEQDKHNPNQIIFKVKDTGKGLTEIEQELLQKKLQQLSFGDDVIGGQLLSGFGLVITQVLISILAPYNKDRLMFKSEQGGITSFWFYLENMLNSQLSSNNTIRKSDQQVQKAPPPTTNSNLILKNNINTSLELGSRPNQKSCMYHINQIKLSEQQQQDAQSEDSHISIFEQPKVNHLQDYNFNSCLNSKQFLQQTTSPMIANQQDMRMSKSFSEPQYVIRQKCLCRKVLVVDDEVFNNDSISLILKQFNFSSVYAFNGKEAIQKFQNDYMHKDNCCNSPNCTIYSFILMDCNMPIMNGWQASKILKQKMGNNELPNIPIFACTAFVGQNEIQKCYESGMDEVILKPVNVSILKKKIDLWNDDKLQLYSTNIKVQEKNQQF